MRNKRTRKGCGYKGEDVTMNKRQVKVLLIEDSSADVGLIRNMLFEEKEIAFSMERADSLSAGLARLARGGLDIVLVDLGLPDSRGLDTFTQIHAHSPHLPMIVLTGLDDGALGVEAIRRGAQDYLMKDGLDSNLLGRAIRYAITRKRMEEKLEEYRDHLEDMVMERTAELKELNEQLLQEIREREQTEAALQNALAEKEILLREVHHRVKNNLQTVAHLISLQRDHVAAAPLQGLFQELQDRVMAMALVHEQLYRSPSLAQVDGALYLNQLVENLVQSFSRPDIAVRVDAAAVFLNLDIAVPYGLIVTELVTNAFKHAFPNRDDKEVYVALWANNDIITLVVRDNGVRLPPDLDWRAPQTLGLELVHSWVTQIKGTLEIDTRQGTEFKIIFEKYSANGGGNGEGWDANFLLI